MATDSRRRDWRDGALVGLAGLALLLIADAFVQDAGAPRGDDQIYELMADRPFETHSFPFAYRFLVPTVVHVLPFGHTFSFSLLAWLSSAACGTVAYVLMRRFAIEPWLAAALALCLVLCPQLFVVSLRQGRNVDPETVLVMLAGGLAIADRRPLALGLIIALGATVRESALFLIPFAYAYWATSPVDREALKRVAAAGLPGLAVYVAIRTGIPTTRNGYGKALDIVKQVLDHPQVELRRIFIAFGPLWLVAPFAVRDLRYARAGVALFACCVFSFLFVRDWGRVVLLAAPAMYVAGAHVLNDRRRLAIAAVAAFVALDVGYAVYMQVHGVEANIINGPAPSYPVR
ncbi:MAG: hypothetical protein QOD71_387 [Thermoleophilaceae bacterium]|jgi:hypothetical protein|nr:hypothetical protein [Thermoleophilaceae bacterium]